VGSTLGFAFVIKELGYAKFNLSVEFRGKGHQNSTQGQEFYPYILCLNSGSGSEGSVNEQGTSTTGSPSTTVSAGSTGSVGSVGESVPSTESPASGTTARGSDSVINPSPRTEYPYENPKFQEFTRLRQEKEDIKESIQEHNHTLKTIEKAKILDKRLPEEAKKDNSYVNELKKEYSDFFEDNSDNEALYEIEHFVKNDKEQLNNQLEETNSKIESLASKSVESYSDTLKRGESETNINNESSSSKRSRKDNGGDDNNSKSSGNSSDPSSGSGSGPSTGSGSGPSSGSGSAPSTGSGSGSSTGSGSAPSQGGSSETSNSYEASDQKDSTWILDFIIKIIKAICGDDNDYMD
jgi:hypothetical protein